MRLSGITKWTDCEVCGRSKGWCEVVSQDHLYVGVWLTLLFL